VLFMGVWRNGQFHVVKLRTKKSVVEMPDGRDGGEETTISTPAEVQSQLPPVDHAFDKAVPTQPQIDAMKVEVDRQEALFTAPPTGPPG
jgi:hypothetical protein